MSINKRKGSSGNVAADMIDAAIQHYKRCNRRIQTVNLSASYWRIFKSFMSKQAPELEIPNEGIQFNDMLIRKGSIFQRDAVKCDLYPIIKEEDRRLPAENKDLSKRIILMN